MNNGVDFFAGQIAQPGMSQHCMDTLECSLLRHKSYSALLVCIYSSLISTKIFSGAYGMKMVLDGVVKTTEENSSVFLIRICYLSSARACGQ